MNAKWTAGSLVVLSLLVGGCGGGGGDGGDSGSGTPPSGGLGGSGSPQPTPVPVQPPYGSFTPPPAVANPVPAPAPEGSVPRSGSSTVGAWSATIIPWQDGTRRWNGSTTTGGQQVTVPKDVLPLHAALLADGRVLSYGTHSFRTDGVYDFDFDIWQPPGGDFAGAEDPARHLILPTGISTHLFCSAQVLIPTTGELLISGGDIWNPAYEANSNVGTNEISIYRPGTNVMSKAGLMAEPRWYATPTTLPNGEMYIQGGTDGRAVYTNGTPVLAEHAEIRALDGKFRTLNGFNTKDLQLNNNYPRNWVAPDGKIFGFDHQLLYKVDWKAKAAGGKLGVMTIFEDTGIPWNNGWATTSTAVMYRPGKILQVGGVVASQPTARDGRETQIIDINGPTPAISYGPRVSQRRQWANTTVLPDGKVVLTGGSEQNVLDDQTNWTTGQVGYRVEIYDPEHNSWTLGPPQQRLRLYHSIALLLPNGTVLSAAGGWPGPQTNMDGEIYYPPYLFQADGSFAPRPKIDSAPTVVSPGGTLSLTTAQADSVRRVTFIKTGSVTHSFNFEQRFLELGNADDPAKPIVRNGNQIQVNLPANPYETPPGFYMVFVLDAAGVPSEAKIVRVNPVS